MDEALPGCQPETTKFLVETAELRPFQSDETLFEQGEPIPMILILRGHGAFRRTTVDGQRLMVGIANPGQLFGITSLASIIASVELVALTDGVVATWRGSDIRALVTNDQGFALYLVDRLSLFLSILTEKVDGFLHQDARRRVIRILARYRDLFFADPAVLTRSQLPSLVGTSREMTGRVLRELEREGTLLRVGRNGLRLLRPDQLDAHAADVRDPG